MLRGWARLGVGATERTLGRGDLLFFHPGQDHALLDCSPDLELFVLGLEPALAERVFDARRPPAAQGATLSSEQLELLSRALSGVADVANTDAVESVIASAFQIATTRMAGGRASTRRALDAIMVAPSASLADIARRLRTHPSDLSRNFHRDYWVTPVELRSRVRLMRFVQGVDTGRDLLRASIEAGFGSYAQCHRVFRRSLGCSPSSYFRGKRSEMDGAVCASADLGDVSCDPACD